jgi:undecaprenyl diphosphate synthase
MDGNGRWAKSRFLPRVMGHRAGASTLREIVSTSLEVGLEYLTVFAFSSENWKRPAEEVDFLMRLFMDLLEKETKHFIEEGIRLVIVGDTSQFSEALRVKIKVVEDMTATNQRLCLTVALNYGGRWDILQAARRCIELGVEPLDMTESIFSSQLSLSYAPDPDLLIRTGGDVRVSNFLLWQFAYTEFFFVEKFWPDFTASDFKRVLTDFSTRERRYGAVLTS